MRYPNVTSLYFATRLVFNAPTEGFILHISQRMAKVQNGEQILPKVSTTKVCDKEVYYHPVCLDLIFVI